MSDSLASTNATTKALEHWLRVNGGYLHPAITICQTDDEGIHFRARDASIKPQTTISSVPHYLSLSYLNALVDDAFPFYKARRNEFKIEAMGFFYLMSQYIHKEQSFWRPYLESLPPPESDHSTPLWFEDTRDLKWLEGTDVLHTALARKKIYRQYYESGIHTLDAAGVHTAPGLMTLFLWAITMYTSRSFSSRTIAPQNSKYWTTYKTNPQGQRQTVLIDMAHAPAADLDFSVLFPGQDAANHNNDAHVDWTFDPGRFSIAVNDQVEAGAEVFNNYGAKSNDELLLGYGFCVADNPYDGVLLTLKPPPRELQTDLRRVHPGYFEAGGDWNGEQATFRLRRPTTLPGRQPDHIFHELPEPLLELLLYILRYERGMPFQFYELPLEYLTDNVNGRRYLPQIARAIVQSLAPKLSILEAVDLPTQLPHNKKQYYAKTYRDGQILILQSIIDALRAFTRSLIKSPLATGSQFLTLEGLIEAWSARSSPEEVQPFIAGLEACSGTADIDCLRKAGWEEDAFVLLLGYIYLSATSSQGSASDGAIESGASTSMLSGSLDRRSDDFTIEVWVRDMLPEYILPALAAPAHEDPEAMSHAQSMMELIETARRLPNAGRWSDDRWSALSILAFGQFLQFESMSMMIPNHDGKGADEARLVLYVHSSIE
ncbi:hypothetical protein M433DRAFT_131898 [Acidomyces richmondensis BFW]|nr:hypothetical protein M433DRAFT_131898 [Acidomyces richmondensis BFW]